MRSLRLTVSEKCLRRLPDAAPVFKTFKARPYIRANYPTRMRLKIKTQKRNESGRAFSIHYRLFVASLIFKPRTAAELTKDGAEYSTNRLVRNYNVNDFPRVWLRTSSLVSTGNFRYQTQDNLAHKVKITAN